MLAHSGDAAEGRGTCTQKAQGFDVLLLSDGAALSGCSGAWRLRGLRETAEMGGVVMKKARQAIRDACLTMQDARKLVARRRKLSPAQRYIVKMKLRAARAWIDEALEELENQRKG